MDRDDVKSNIEKGADKAKDATDKVADTAKGMCQVFCVNGQFLFLHPW